MSEKTKAPEIEEIRSQLALRSKIHSFFDSALIFALVDLGIFAQLQDQPRTLQELSRKVGVDQQDLARVLRPACASRLLTRDPAGGYSIPSELRGSLDEGSPSSVIPWIRFMRSIAPHLFSLSQVVRSRKRKSLRQEDYCLYDAELGSFTQAMHIYALTLGSELVDHLDLSETRSLLDAACGSGTYSLLLAQRFPGLKVTLMDAANVLEVARRTAETMGLKDRAEFHSGDALRDPLPGRFDCVLISNTLHLIGREAAQALIRRGYEVLNPGGQLVIQGQFLSGAECENSWPAMLDLVLLCGSPEGENHSAAEAEEWLQAAGFSEIQHRRMSPLNANSLVTGVKPHTGHREKHPKGDE